MNDAVLGNFANEIGKRVGNALVFGDFDEKEGSNHDQADFEQEDHRLLKCGHGSSGNRHARKKGDKRGIGQGNPEKGEGCKQDQKRNQGDVVHNSNISQMRAGFESKSSGIIKQIMLIN